MPQSLVPFGATLQQRDRRPRAVHQSRINARPLISCSGNRDRAGKATFLTQSSNMVIARVATTLEQKEGMRGMLYSFHAQLDSRGIITIVLGKVNCD
jgi:hypothetical protein